MGCICSGSSEVINPNQVDLSHFEIHKCVGKGGFGKVHAVIKKTDGKMYAMKSMEKSFLLAKESNFSTMWAERFVMSKFNSPFLVHLYHAFQDKESLYLVMNFMKGGDLRYYLEKKGAMKEDVCKFFAAEMLLGLEEMHSHNVIYTDLKPENILLDDDGHIRISDFGLCVQLKKEHNYLHHGERGTDGYIAPELLRREYYGYSPDVWTLGIVIYELIHNHRPFHAKTVLIDELVLSEKISPLLRDLISKLLEKDPTKRLGCGPDKWDEVKRHEWFSSIDWTAAKQKTLKPPFLPDPDVAHCSPVFELEEQLLAEKKTHVFTLEQQERFKGFSYETKLEPSNDNMILAKVPENEEKERS